MRLSSIRTGRPSHSAKSHHPAAAAAAAAAFLVKVWRVCPEAPMGMHGPTGLMANQALLI